MGLESEKAFPFIYTFRNRSDDAWAAQTTITAQAAAITNVVNGIGPTVPAASRITHNVMLDADYIFKLLSIKYTACYVSSTPDYQWYENCGILQSDGLDPDMNKIGTPLSCYIGMTLSFSGAQAQVLYGGDDCGPVPRMQYGSRREPILVNSIQGYDYGFLALRTPKLLTQQACLIFDITNTHPTKDLVVGAVIYGMKIRM
jgi:hypothetical protein